jgi:cell division protein FtsL
MTRVKTKEKRKSEKLSHKIIYYALVTYAAILSAIFIIGFSMLLYTLATDPQSINSANFGYLEFLGGE